MPPANDDFANATDLGSVTSGSVSGTNVGATLEAGEPALNGAGDSTQTVWWKWTAPADGTITVTTLGSTAEADGSTLDTVLDMFEGPDLAGLVEDTFNDDGSVDVTSEIDNQVVTNGTTYYFRVYGFTNDTGGGTFVGSLVFNWTFTPAGPLTITTTSPLPNGQEGQGYDQFIAAIGGSGTGYTWAVGAGLPAGLTLDAATGELSGTPTVSGDFTFTITVTDSASNTDSKTFDLTICPANEMALLVTSPDGAQGNWSPISTPWDVYGLSAQRTSLLGDDGTNLLVGGLVLPGVASTDRLILRSTDRGVTWSAISTPLDSLTSGWVRGLAYSPTLGRWVAIVHSNDITRHHSMYSDDGGATWTVGGALPFTATNTGESSNCVWTGTYFLVGAQDQGPSDVVEPRLAYSADGTAWGAILGTPFDESSDDGSGSIGSLGTDGAGTVIAAGVTTRNDSLGIVSQTALAISTDHGATWALGYTESVGLNHHPVVIEYLDGTFIIGWSLASGTSTTVLVSVTSDAVTLAWIDLSSGATAIWGVGYRPDTDQLLVMVVSTVGTQFFAIGPSGSGLTPTALAVETADPNFQQGWGGTQLGKSVKWLADVSKWIGLPNTLWTPPCGAVPGAPGGHIGKMVF